MDLNQLLLEFLDELEFRRKVSPLTIRNYKHYLSRFFYFLEGSPHPLLVMSVKSLYFREIFDS